MSTGPDTSPTRALTPRERDVLVAMISSGACDDGPRVTGDDRARWLAQVEQTRAGRTCTCGTCPSIELTDATGAAPGLDVSRVVLAASTTEAILLLFVDDDRLSYLELAPLGDDATVHRFPAVPDIDFG